MVFIKGALEFITSEGASKMIEQLKNCICKIKIDKIEGTGFFCFIPFNNKCLPVLISAYYIMNLNSPLHNISIELNNETKIIKIDDGRKTFANRELNISIIEIIPERDNIFNFMEIDENFISISDREYSDISAYILQYNDDKKLISCGLVKNIRENKVLHSCNTTNFSGGAPILNLTSGKIIGIHFGSKLNVNYNYGIFIKPTVMNFIKIYKDYINTDGLTNNKYSSNNGFYSINRSDSNLNLNEIHLNNNNEKKLEEKINDLNNILKEKLAKANAIISKNYQLIEELKVKLSRFPFELLEGEKMMSIIVTSTDKKNIRSIICKNTNLFCDLEKQIYHNKDNIFDIGTDFTIDGRIIDETKSLDDNKIRDNDIIIMNKLNV